MKAYKMTTSHPTESARCIETAVRGLMDELLDGIVRNFADNPTIPDDDSRAEPPSPL